MASRFIVLSSDRLIAIERFLIFESLWSTGVLASRLPTTIFTASRINSCFVPFLEALFLQHTCDLRIFEFFSFYHAIDVIQLTDGVSLLVYNGSVKIFRASQLFLESVRRHFVIL